MVSNMTTMTTQMTRRTSIVPSRIEILKRLDKLRRKSILLLFGESLIIHRGFAPPLSTNILQFRLKSYISEELWETMTS